MTKKIKVYVETGHFNHHTQSYVDDYYYFVFNGFRQPCDTMREIKILATEYYGPDIELEVQ